MIVKYIEDIPGIDPKIVEWCGGLFANETYAEAVECSFNLGSGLID
jgi:hypothetical protein